MFRISGAQVYPIVGALLTVGRPDGWSAINDLPFYRPKTLGDFGSLPILGFFGIDFPLSVSRTKNVTAVDRTLPPQGVGGQSKKA